MKLSTHLAPVEVLRTSAAGHTIAVTARPPAWPTYFTAAELTEFRGLDWYARRERRRIHECYLTATRVYVGAYPAPPGTVTDVEAQRAVVAEVTGALAERGVALPDPGELTHTPFAGSPRRPVSPGFLCPAPLRCGPLLLHSVFVDCG